MKCSPPLPGPLSELPIETQELICACVPESEYRVMPEDGRLAFTARGMVAMFEGVKKYGPPDIAAFAEMAIPQMIKAANAFAAKEKRKRK